MHRDRTFPTTHEIEHFFVISTGLYVDSCSVRPLLLSPCSRVFHYLRSCPNTPSMTNTNSLYAMTVEPLRRFLQVQKSPWPRQAIDEAFAAA